MIDILDNQSLGMMGANYKCLEDENARLRAELELVRKERHVMCEDNTRLRAELDAEREKQRWIPVEERLPEYDEKCIVYLVDDIGAWVDARRYCGEPIGWDLYSSKAICWRPLPAPPEQQP